MYIDVVIHLGKLRTYYWKRIQDLLEWDLIKGGIYDGRYSDGD